MKSLTSVVMAVISLTTVFPTSTACSRTHGTANTKVAPAGMQVAVTVVTLLLRSINFVAVSMASETMGVAVCTTVAVQLYTLLPVQTSDIPYVGR